MKTSLRVLAAAIEGREADQVDVDELRRLAPLLSGMPLDELACHVIRQAIDRAEERRARSKAANTWKPDLHQQAHRIAWRETEAMPRKEIL